MSLKQVLSEAFSGGRQVPLAGFGAQLDEIVHRAGSHRKAAALLGVHHRTVQRWLAGQFSDKPRFAGPREAKVLHGFRGLYRVPTDGITKLTVDIAQGGHGPTTRSVDVDAAAVKAAGDAWQRGDLDGMVREFRAGITDPWYRETLFRPQAGDPGYRAAKSGRSSGPGGRAPGTAGGGGGYVGGGHGDDDDGDLDYDGDDGGDDDAEPYDADDGYVYDDDQGQHDGDDGDVSGPFATGVSFA